MLVRAVALCQCGAAGGARRGSAAHEAAGERLRVTRRVARTRVALSRRVRFCATHQRTAFAPSSRCIWPQRRAGGARMRWLDARTVLLEPNAEVATDYATCQGAAPLPPRFGLARPYGAASRGLDAADGSDGVDAKALGVDEQAAANTGGEPRRRKKRRRRESDDAAALRAQRGGEAERCACAERGCSFALRSHALQVPCCSVACSRERALALRRAPRSSRAGTGCFSATRRG